ncbi:hypothetical protein ACS5PK_03450 [Roseateles sp. DB2]|uniref:hypothetical protein n=1 Tax=Roseateles sp. DB2 TaxID=3453717 RepID=UPI003EEDDD23
MQRLLDIQAVDALRPLVPPLLPIAALADFSAPASRSHAECCEQYAELLHRQNPELLAQVQQVCGSAPWIVRSAGDEDSELNSNAGAYESRPCADAQALFLTVAAVATSAWRPQTQQQQALSSASPPPRAIDCFIQPLLTVETSTPGSSQVPYLSKPTLERMEAVATQLIAQFGMQAIDCEWGLETDAGFVSATTMLPADHSRMHTAHTFGFGFASAQTSGQGATSLALRPAGTPLRLWRGRHLRQVQVRQVHLLQARPTPLDEAYRQRQVLTSQARARLAAQYASLPVTLLLLGRRAFGRCLTAPDLATAWRRFIAMDPAVRLEIDLVLVDEGNAEEHAGIMFRQQQMTCVRGNTGLCAPGWQWACLDEGRSYMGDGSLLQYVETEERHELVLPDECGLVFSPTQAASPGSFANQDAEAQLQSLAELPVDERVARELRQVSLWPSADRWLEERPGFLRSPALRACQIEAEPGSACEAPLSGDGDPSGLWKDYTRALRLDAQDLQRLAASLACEAASLRSLALSEDLRLRMALLGAQQQVPLLGAPELAKLFRFAATLVQEGQPDAARLALLLPQQLADETKRLPLYEPAELAQCFASCVQALADGMSPFALAAVRSFGLAAPTTARLAQSHSAHPPVVAALSALQQRFVQFRGAVLDPLAPELAELLNTDFQRARQLLLEAGLGGVSEQLRSTLIEAYDATLKSLLTQAVIDGDTGSYHRYLRMMLCWLASIAQQHLTPQEEQVLALFRHWIKEWQQGPMPDSFEIDDRNWRVEFDALAAEGAEPERYENAHVIHNLLHQWSLATLHIESGLLPARVQALELLCSTFSSRATKVLRFEQGLLEIQIPMGTHKASFVFGPERMAVEWSEPPNCPTEEIARIVAFEQLLGLLRDTQIPSLSFRRERTLGTWTLLIHANLQPGGSWRFEDLHQFIAANRLLFDAAYDFSYVPVEAADGLMASLQRPGWGGLMQQLVAHRSQLEDAAQYVALHTLPLSSTVSALAQSAVVRSLMLRGQRAGFRACVTLLDRYAAWLNLVESPERWRHRHEYLRQLCVLMGSHWPVEALETLRSAPALHVGHELLASVVLQRRDCRKALLPLLGASPSLQTPLAQCSVKYAPELLVQAWGAHATAELLKGQGARYRRARQLLVARHAGELPITLVRQLLTDMDTVPWGEQAAAEHRIAECLAKTGPRYRFALSSGVDWTALDHWADGPANEPARHEEVQAV